MLLHSHLATDRIGGVQAVAFPVATTGSERNQCSVRYIAVFHCKVSLTFCKVAKPIYVRQSTKIVRCSGVFQPLRFEVKRRCQL